MSYETYSSLPRRVSMDGGSSDYVAAGSGRGRLRSSSGGTPAAVGEKERVVHRLGGVYKKTYDEVGFLGRVGRVGLGILGAIPAAGAYVAGKAGCKGAANFANRYHAMGKALWRGETNVHHAVTTPPPGPRPRAEIYGPIQADIEAGRLKITVSESGSYGYILLPRESAVIFVPRAVGSNTEWDYSKMRKMTVHYSTPDEREDGNVLSDKVDAIVLRKYAECISIVGDKILEAYDKLPAGANPADYLVYMDVDSKKLALVRNDHHGNFDIESGAGHIEIRGIEDETWKSLEKIWKDDAKEKTTTKAVNEPDEPSRVGSAASRPWGSPPPPADDATIDERRRPVRGSLAGAPGRPLAKEELIDHLIAADPRAAVDPRAAGEMREKLRVMETSELAEMVAALPPPPPTGPGVAPSGAPPRVRVEVSAATTSPTMAFPPKDHMIEGIIMAEQMDHTLSSGGVAARRDALNRMGETDLQALYRRYATRAPRDLAGPGAPATGPGALPPLSGVHESPFAV